MSNTKNTGRPASVEQLQHAGLTFLEKQILLARQREAAKDAKRREKLAVQRRQGGALQAAPVAPPPPAEPAQDADVGTLQIHVDAICADYRKGETQRSLAAKYKTTIPMIRRALVAGKVEIRQVGRIPGKPQPAYDRLIKVTDEKRQWILDQDEKGVEHAIIAKKLGISRERVRQVCMEEGRPTRRDRQREAREQAALAAESDRVSRALERQSRAMEVDPTMQKAADLWAAGKAIKAIAKSLREKPATMGVKLMRWRQRHPDLFPRRNRASTVLK